MYTAREKLKITIFFEHISYTNTAFLFIKIIRYTSSIINFIALLIHIQNFGIQNNTLFIKKFTYTRNSGEYCHDDGLCLNKNFSVSESYFQLFGA